MPLSPTARDSAQSALAAILMFADDIRDNLTAAYSASNSASSRDLILRAKEDIDILKKRADDAYFDAVRAAKLDEEAPAVLRLVRAG